MNRPVAFYAKAAYTAAEMRVNERDPYIVAQAPDKIEVLFSSRWSLVVFLLIAAASAAIGIHHAFTWAFDFQWPAAYLLAHGHDPWIEALQSHRNLTDSASVPNYLHELYVLYLPLTLFSEQTARVLWAIANVTMAWLSLSMLCTIYRIPQSRRLLFVLIFMGSISFRTGLGAGQFCFAELFLFCIIYRFSRAPLARGLSLGVSFAKYSFSPVIALAFLLKGRVLVVAASALPFAAGLGICMWLLHKPLFPLLIEPLLVARQGVSPGFADLMTLGERLFGRDVAGAVDAATLVLALLYAFRLSRKRDLSEQAEFAQLAVASLFLFKHLIYDYIFLTVPLAYALSDDGLLRRARWLVLGIVAYVWFGSPLYMGLESVRERMPLLLLNCGCLGALLLILDLGGNTSTAESYDQEVPAPYQHLTGAVALSEYSAEEVA